MADISSAGIPSWVAWLKYVAFGYWAFAALLVNEFGDGRPDVVVRAFRHLVATNETAAAIAAANNITAEWVFAEAARLALLPCDWAKPLE